MGTAWTWRACRPLPSTMQQWPLPGGKNSEPVFRGTGHKSLRHTLGYSHSPWGQGNMRKPEVSMEGRRLEDTTDDIQGLQFRIVEVCRFQATCVPRHFATRAAAIVMALWVAVVRWDPKAAASRHNAWLVGWMVGNLSHLVTGNTSQAADQIRQVFVHPAHGGDTRGPHCVQSERGGGCGYGGEEHDGGEEAFENCEGDPQAWHALGAAVLSHNVATHSDKDVDELHRVDRMLRTAAIGGTICDHCAWITAHVFVLVCCGVEWCGVCGGGTGTA